jgi:hypothetical protein
LSAAAAGSLFAVGAALLALWTLVRFPALGPQTIRQAGIAVAAVLLAESPVLAGSDAVSRSAGDAVALLFVILPFLTLLFWASACLLRSLVGLLAPYVR